MPLPTPTLSRYQGSWAVWFGTGYCVCESEAEARELLAIKLREAAEANARPEARTPMRMDPRDAGVRHRASGGRR